MPARLPRHPLAKRGGEFDVVAAIECELTAFSVYSGL